jgi:hypothetical protein
MVRFLELAGKVAVNEDVMVDSLAVELRRFGLSLSIHY